MAKSKSSKLPTHQIHAALPSQPNDTIFNILNPVNKNPYTHVDATQYETFLRELSTSKLQDHAVETANVVPTDDRERLIGRLVEEFAKFQGRLKGQKAAIANGPSDGLNDKARKSIEDIMKSLMPNRG
jgi:hypothetical protein